MSDFITVAELRIEAERLCDENEHLQAENARLRSYLSDDVENARMIMDENSRLREQNAKLRELMSVMAYCIQGWRDCDGCRVNGGAGIITERAGCYVLLDRLRELGVEVSDD